METLKLVFAISVFGTFMLSCAVVTLWRIGRFARMAWRRMRRGGDAESRGYFREFGQALVRNTKHAVGAVTVLPIVVFFSVFQLGGFVVLYRLYSGG